MSFYDLPKNERSHLVSTIFNDILAGFEEGTHQNIITYFEDEDTYIRKSAYIAIGHIYYEHRALQTTIITTLEEMLAHPNYKVSQTVINAAGEIGKKDFAVVEPFFHKGLFDAHHAPRNAVIGSIKKMGEVNPVPVLAWAKTYLLHQDKEIRREICHGIELRGRKYPQDILPMLKELQFDKTARVRNTLVHVIGQIAYKRGCLETVIKDLKTWENKQLVAHALEEIIDVHHRYQNFAALTQDEARTYIKSHF